MTPTTSSLLLAAALLVGTAAACSRSDGASGSPSAAAGAASTSAPPADPPAAIHWDDTPIDWTRPVPVTPAGGEGQAGYVGSEACRDCHRDIYDRYARHSMARTGIRPLASLDAAWLAKIFDAAKPVQHERSRYFYRPYRRAGRYFVEEYLLADDGSRVQSRVEPLEYAYSAGSYGMAFFFRQGSRLYQAPVDYYAQTHVWGIDPGASEGNPRFSKPLGAFCISCHADYPRRRAGTDEVFVQPIPRGVGCERCHGPGQKHVTSPLAGGIVDPARLPLERQLDVCVQCHESDHSGLRADRDEYGFRPGEPATAYRVNFVADPPDPDRFVLLAHPERMVESACWKKSAGRLVCTSCHDPHRSSFDQPPSWWDAKCLACHQNEPCTETAQARASRGGHCVTCHMRSGPPTRPTLVSITDHWIQRRPSPVRAGTDGPRRLVSWPELVGQPASGGDLAALQVLAYARDGQLDRAERQLASLTPAALRVPGLDEWMAERYLQTRRPADAARAYAEALHVAPDARPALLGYARVMLDRGDRHGSDEAMHALDRMLALDPDDPDALQTKAMVLFRAGRVDEARPLFVHAAAVGPANAASRVALAAIALREGHDAEATAQLEAARSIAPADPWILGKLCGEYAKAGDAAHAEAVERARAYFAKQARPTDATRWLPEAWR